MLNESVKPVCLGDTSTELEDCQRKEEKKEEYMIACSAHEEEVATDLAGDGGGWRMYS